MVTLQGANFDCSNQVFTKLSTAVIATDTVLTVESTTGFAADDYIILDINNEEAEIVKIATVDSITQLTVSAVVQAHAVNAKIIRTPYNQMKFYECATATGTYTLVTASTIDMDYSQQYTNFPYPTGDADYYFKRTFYNETSAVESDIALANYWQTDDEQYLITADEIRRFIQFDENDYPSKADYRFFISLASDKLSLDSDTVTGSFARLAMFYLTKWFVFRALASRSLAKGYITINAEGRNITKATQELVLEAENTIGEYRELLINNDRTEVTSTKFMDNRDLVSAETEQKIKDIMTGTQNAMDFQQDYGRKRRIGE